MQFFEQQSALPLQALPAVLQDGFKPWHEPLAQFMEQHGEPPAVHAWPSETHAAAPQVPFGWQLRLQQSVAF